MYETLYEKIVDGLVNDGYIVLDNALDASLAKELLREAQSRDDFKKQVYQQLAIVMRIGVVTRYSGLMKQALK